MKRLLLILIWLLCSASEAREINISPEKSTVKWTGKKGLEILGEHYGYVKVKKGKVTLDDKEQITAAEIEIDMTQITNEDLSGELKDKLLVHLRNDDFFAVTKYKSAKFKSTSIKKIGADTYKLTGDMTIKGVTKPAEILGTYSKNGSEYGFKGNCIFDRTAYGIKYGSGNFFTNLGDKMIHNEVVLDFAIVAK